MIDFVLPKMAILAGYCLYVKDIKILVYAHDPIRIKTGMKTFYFNDSKKVRVVLVESCHQIFVMRDFSGFFRRKVRVRESTEFYIIRERKKPLIKISS
ncbi:hypothetical protein P343_12530 [Sporolactobacillus laevolacticus DSM 442]|uniref:Uncharacterized protein n=1 Tax=Sporolactobacillus laevolacticus DSM 442 TaxID=1395513 RepID=V6IVK0_9BACL|nr:hypothetical protein P343_12530 [Sporolactobacillus laevolacticus DSM 442]